MRRLSILVLAFVAAGCRHVAVSNEGRIASASRTGTYVADVGRVAGGSEAIAWSPDGTTLAIHKDGGTLLWPKGKIIPKFQPPFAWSPDGKSLAGWDGTKVVALNLASGTRRTPRLTFHVAPERLGWTLDGKPFGYSAIDGVRVDGLGLVARPRSDFEAVAPTQDGGLVWLDGLRLGSGNALAEMLAVPIHVGHWSPGRKLSNLPMGTVGDLLASPTEGSLSLPTFAAIAPGGKRLAIAGIVAEGSPEAIAKLRRARKKEDQDRLLKRLRTRAVVVLIEEDERRRELWCAPLELDYDAIGVEDLAWSADGRWLAIGLADRTVRLAL